MARHKWSNREVELVRNLYPHHTTNYVAAKLRLTTSQIIGAAARHGLRKSAKYLADLEGPVGKRLSKAGEKFRYPKGHVPANKGLRRPGYVRGRMAETQFRKGHRPRNWKPIGTVVVDGDGYLRRKIAEGPSGFGNPKAWELVHKRVWIDANGPIPRGHCIWFKDQNKANCSLENLELITQAENMRRNTIHNLPKHLVEVIMLKGTLKRQLRRKENGKEQIDRSS